MNVRWVLYEGCGNVRDIGGYRTREGRTVRWRRVYRADALSRLSDRTAARAVEELGLRTVVDLRTEAEVAALAAGFRFDELGVRVVHLPTDNPEVDAIRQSGVVGMGALYLRDLDRKAASFARILDVLADVRSLPCVIQCRSGKDRTGIVVALILDLLGVPERTIVDEYVLTEEALMRVPRAEYEATRERLAQSGMDPEIVHANGATMSRFLQGLRARWGSAESYVKTVGLGADVIAAVRTNLLA